jgi:hypothetical protein
LKEKEKDREKEKEKENYRRAAGAPADDPHEVVLAGGGGLDGEGPTTVPLAAVLARGPGAHHLGGDEAAVATRKSLADAIVVELHDGVAGGGLAHSVRHDGHLHLPQDRLYTGGAGIGGAPA